MTSIFTTYILIILIFIHTRFAEAYYPPNYLSIHDILNSAANNVMRRRLEHPARFSGPSALASSLGKTSAQLKHDFELEFKRKTKQGKEKERTCPFGSPDDGKYTYFVSYADTGDTGECLTDEFVVTSASSELKSGDAGKASNCESKTLKKHITGKDEDATECEDATENPEDAKQKIIFAAAEAIQRMSKETTGRKSQFSKCSFYFFLRLILSIVPIVNYSFWNNTSGQT